MRACPQSADHSKTQPAKASLATEVDETRARSIACRIAYRKILLVGRSWPGEHCAGHSKGDARAPR
jgi:hypothetical protein